MPRRAPSTSETAASHEEGEPEVDMQIDRAEPDRIGTEAEEGGLREIDLAAQAEHDGEPEHRDRIGRGLDEDVQDVVVEGREDRASAAAAVSAR